MSEIRDNKLIRQIPIYSNGGCTAIQNELVITKEEFLACYNAWVLKGDSISRNSAVELLKKWSDGYTYIEIPTEDAINQMSSLPTISPDMAQVLAYESGKASAERPQGDIRWTDKLSVKSNGDIIDFEGRVVGHIDLEDMRGGEENDS